MWTEYIISHSTNGRGSPLRVKNVLDIYDKSHKSWILGGHDRLNIGLWQSFNFLRGIPKTLSSFGPLYFCPLNIHIEGAE